MIIGAQKDEVTSRMAKPDTKLDFVRAHLSCVVSGRDKKAQL